MHLEHAVRLLQSRVLDAVEGVCDVLVAVASGSGADVHDDVLRIDAQLGHDGVELLCEVDVDGRFRADLLVVGKACGRADSLVVFVAGGENEDVLTGQSFGDLVEELGVLLDVLAAHDDDRHRHSIGNCLGERDALFDGLVRAVGIGALKVQTQEICALHRLGTLGHVNHSLAAGVERLLAGHRVLRHAEVRQLNADLRSVLDFCIERVERQYVLTADRSRFFANAQHNFIDVGIESLLLGNERHNVESPYIIIFWLTNLNRA